MKQKKTTQFLLLALLALFPAISGSAHAADEIALAKGQTIYVPAYSHIYVGDREQPFLLTVTLSFRNVDTRHKVTLTAVDYYDTKGRLLKKYLPQPLVLNPLESTRYVVPQQDKTGGSGANFLVEWRAEQPVNPPLVEAVMIGAASQQGISFTSRGQVITTGN